MRWHESNATTFIKTYMNPAYRHQVAGSIRRRTAIANDIDIVTTQPLSWLKRRLEDQGHGPTGGEHVLTVEVAGSKINVIHANPGSFGATLMYATGPKGANIRNRVIAKQKGWRLNQHGLHDARGRLIASSEKAIYERLGKTWRPAERRGLPRHPRS